MKDAITYANESGFFEFNVVGWKTEFERLIEAVCADALAEQATVNDSLTVQDHIRDATKMVKRPQNCGTGFCSCIECVVKPDHIAHVRKMVPDHIADTGKMVTLTAEAAQQIEETLDESYAELCADSHRDGPRCLLLTTMEQALAAIRAARAQEPIPFGQPGSTLGFPSPEPFEQEPVAWISAKESFCGFPKLVFSETRKDGYKPLYAAPVKQAERGPVADHFYFGLEEVEDYLRNCANAPFMADKVLEYRTRHIQQNEIEPLAFARFVNGTWLFSLFKQPDSIPLYTAPVRTKDLTDDEIADVFRTIHVKESWSLGFARAVIAADREKNSGRSPALEKDCGGAHHHRYVGSFGHD